jgi:hypothetical protein
MGCAASSARTTPPMLLNKSAESSRISTKIQELESLLLTNKLRFAQCVKQKNIEGARSITAHNMVLRKDILMYTRQLKELDGVNSIGSVNLKSSQRDIVSSTMSAPPPTVVSPAEPNQSPL